MLSPKDELKQVKLEYGLVQETYCAAEEQQLFNQMMLDHQPLPDDVVKKGSSLNGFYRYSKGALSSEDAMLLCMSRQAKHLETIKICLLFFVVVAIIPLVIAFVNFVGVVLW